MERACIEENIEIV